MKRTADQPPRTDLAAHLTSRGHVYGGDGFTHVLLSPALIAPSLDTCMPRETGEALTAAEIQVTP